MVQYKVTPSAKATPECMRALQSHFMVTATSTSLRLRKAQFVREATRESALRLFVDKGFEETTIDDIAASAGIARRTFFRHFESKGDLLTQSVVRHGSSVADTIRASPRSWPAGTVLRHVVLEAVQHSAADPQTKLVMAVLSASPAAREAQLARAAAAQQRIAEAYTQRFGATRRGALQSHLLAGLTLSLIGTGMRHWHNHGHKDATVIVQQLFAELASLASEWES